MAGSLDFSPDRINDLHRQAEIWRDKTIADSGQACRCVIECGTLLILAKAKCKHGDWLLWLGANCPLLSETTAKRYMRCSEKYRPALADGSIDFQTLKELYIASGIMPEPESQTEEPGKPNIAAWMRWTEKLDGLIEKLKADERERFRQWCQLVLQRL